MDLDTVNKELDEYFAEIPKILDGLYQNSFR